MRKGRGKKKKHRGTGYWFPVIGGPLDGSDCELCECTVDGFKYITPNGAIHVYRRLERPVDNDSGLVECHYQHSEIR